MTNKITKEFLEFCCKYARIYIFEYHEENCFAIIVNDRGFDSCIICDIEHLKNIPHFILRDLIQRARQGIWDNYINEYRKWKKDESLPDNYLEKIFYIMPDYAREEIFLSNDDNTIEKDFYFKDYQGNDIFTVEEQAIIDAINFIMENQK